MTLTNDAAVMGLSPGVLSALQNELARTPQVEKAQVYGSRAKGNYRPGSDIDIALFGTTLTPQHLLTLDNRLDDLLLPYQIDLCHFDTLQNPTLIDHIQRLGITIYSRP
jgi:predicted nucleotidyltransferase